MTILALAHVINSQRTENIDFSKATDEFCVDTLQNTRASTTM